MTYSSRVIATGIEEIDQVKVLVMDNKFNQHHWPALAGRVMPLGEVPPYCLYREVNNFGSGN